MQSSNITVLFWMVVLVLNIISLVLVAVDKSKARRHRWRISEKTFFGLAILGGSIGVYSGCLLFRHKTKHLRFMVGLPVLIIVQILFLLMRNYL